MINCEALITCLYGKGVAGLDCLAPIHVVWFGAQNDDGRARVQGN